MGKKNKNQNKKNKNMFDQEEKSEEDDLRIWKKAINRFKHGIDIVVLRQCVYSMQDIYFTVYCLERFWYSPPFWFAPTSDSG